MYGIYVTYVNICTYMHIRMHVMARYYICIYIITSFTFFVLGGIGKVRGNECDDLVLVTKRELKNTTKLIINYNLKLRNNRSVTLCEYE